VAPKNAVTPEVWEALKGLGQESALSIRGTVREDSRAPGGFEIDLLDAEVIDEVHDYPITPKEHGTEFLMDHRHLWLRSRRQNAILKVRHTVVKAVRDFLESFRGGPPTPMHPSPSNDTALLRRRSTRQSTW
jgi:asparaginyl-tRNA synthetase